MDSHDEGYCYEAPDGLLIYSSQEDHIEVMTLFEVYDEEGNSYLVDRVGLSC
jgi:hypothetical protein